MTFVDTPGASPDAASEERGQAEAIARSIQLMTRLRTPIVTVITGEGGSGGALAIAVGDVVLALENAIYSVISPEGCASILWRTPEAAKEAAVAMRLTAGEQQALGVIDVVIPETGRRRAREPGWHGSLKAAIDAQLDTAHGQGRRTSCWMRATTLPAHGRLRRARTAAPAPRAAPPHRPRSAAC